MDFITRKEFEALEKRVAALEPADAPHYPEQADDQQPDAGTEDRPQGTAGPTNHWED